MKFHSIRGRGNETTRSTIRAIPVRSMRIKWAIILFKLPFTINTNSFFAFDYYAREIRKYFRGRESASEQIRRICRIRIEIQRGASIVNRRAPLYDSSTSSTANSIISRRSLEPQFNSNGRCCAFVVRCPYIPSPRFYVILVKGKLDNAPQRGATRFQFSRY